MRAPTPLLKSDEIGRSTKESPSVYHETSRIGTPSAAFRTNDQIPYCFLLEITQSTFTLPLFSISIFSLTKFKIFSEVTWLFHAIAVY